MTIQTYPIAIAGAGITGSVLALALAQAAQRVCLIESRPAPPRAASAASTARGRRPIALSLASERIFRGLGLWQVIAPHATPIRTVHVSERGKFGVTRICAEDFAVNALGHVCEARYIETVLSEALQEFSGTQGALQQRYSRTVSHARTKDSAVRVQLIASASASRAGSAVSEQIDARLLVAADGANSELRDIYQLPVLEREYQQVALVCRVRSALPHQGTAFERFTDQGPLALLPLSEDRSAVVWSLPREKGEAIAELADSAFVKQLHEQFGQRLGRFSEVSTRSCFPLKLIQSRTLTGPRFAVVGNAAQQLHPVGGQGLNLGLRDVALLAELIFEQLHSDGDPGGQAMLTDYARGRLKDRRWVVGFTDFLARGVTPSFAKLSALRGLGLLTVDLLPFVKTILARHTMGLAGYQPRLVRGMPLVGPGQGGGAS